jgi:sec-independent protein translocase protein TatA
MFGGIGIPELLLIFGILLLLFGARKLPEIGRGLGEGIRSFKSSLSGESEEEKKEEKVVKAKEIEAEVKKEEQLEAKQKIEEKA